MINSTKSFLLFVWAHIYAVLRKGYLQSLGEELLRDWAEREKDTVFPLQDFWTFDAGGPSLEVDGDLFDRTTPDERNLMANGVGPSRWPSWAREILNTVTGLEYAAFVHDVDYCLGGNRGEADFRFLMNSVRCLLAEHGEGFKLTHPEFILLNLKQMQRANPVLFIRLGMAQVCYWALRAGGQKAFDGGHQWAKDMGLGKSLSPAFGEQRLDIEGLPEVLAPEVPPEAYHCGSHKVDHRWDKDGTADHNRFVRVSWLCGHCMETNYWLWYEDDAGRLPEIMECTCKHCGRTTKGATVIRTDGPAARTTACEMLDQRLEQRTVLKQ